MCIRQTGLFGEAHVDLKFSVLKTEKGVQCLCLPQSSIREQRIVLLLREGVSQGCLVFHSASQDLG